MQSSKIKVGTDYAYSTSAGRRRVPAMLGDAYNERATVLASPEAGTVLVRIEGEDPRRVSIKTLIGTWADHEFAATQRAAYRAESIDRMRAASKRCAELTGRKPSQMGHGLDGEVYNDGSYSAEGRISVYDLRDLLEAAYAKGKADARALDAIVG